MTLSTRVQATVSATYSTSRDLGTPSYAPSMTFSQSLATGTSTNQNDLLFDDERTITASSSENIDLSGVLLDAFGTTLTFVKVKGICVIADSGNTNNVVVGGAASNPFQGPLLATTGTISVAPGDVWLSTKAASGWTVDPLYGDQLKVANSGSGTSVTYRLLVWGTSA